MAYATPTSTVALIIRGLRSSPAAEVVEFVCPHLLTSALARFDMVAHVAAGAAELEREQRLVMALGTDDIDRPR